MNILTTLKQALEALEYGSLDRYPNSVADIRCKEACADLRAAINQIEKAEPAAFAVQLAEDGSLSWNTIWEERWAANDHLNSLIQEGLHTGECHVLPLYTSPPDAQAEIERLTKELDAYCEKWHKELALGDELRYQLSAAVSHGAELMRGREGWQPIETAPKDGTDILVMYMHIDTQIVHNAFWNEYEDCDDSETGWWSYEHSEVSRIKLDDWMTPTHWMPLPAAPKPGEKE